MQGDPAEASVIANTARQVIAVARGRQRTAERDVRCQWVCASRLSDAARFFQRDDEESQS